MFAQLRSRSSALSKRGEIARPVLLTLLALAACGEEASGVSYAGDVRPLFEDRCVYCHQPGAPFGPETGQGMNLQDPFAAADGLVNAVNFWKEGHPELPVPERALVPGAPDDSFIINKISPAEQGLLPEDGAGKPMPYQVPAMTADELTRVEQWVSDGAQDDDFFRCQVYYLFMPSPELARSCRIQHRYGEPGKCDACHFAGTPNPPDLSDPFGPNGLVNVQSNFRADLLRVAPGSPDDSLLIQKLRLSANGNLPNSQFGAPMPKPILPLSAEQVETVRQWILAGARP